MNYITIKKTDIANGPGVRVTLFVSGCSHHCPGCHNPNTWNSNEGILFDDKAKKEILDQLNKDYISGITFSGGDPLYVANRVEILELINIINIKYPNKTIWLYTGYTLEELLLKNNTIINHILQKIDVLVDGEFIEELKDIKYKWAGSTNQKIYKLR